MMNRPLPYPLLLTVGITTGLSDTVDAVVYLFMYPPVRMLLVQKLFCGRRNHNVVGVVAR